MRLLVADDDSSLRLALRLVLEDAGHEVVEVGSVSDARRIIETQDLDFALIDAGMCQEGVALWDELESAEEFRGRALLLTGDLLTLGYVGNHDGVISKPFDFGALLTRIEGAGPRDGPATDGVPRGGPDAHGRSDGAAAPREEPPSGDLYLSG